MVFISRVDQEHNLLLCKELVNLFTHLKYKLRLVEVKISEELIETSKILWIMFGWIKNRWSFLTNHSLHETFNIQPWLDELIKWKQIIVNYDKWANDDQPGNYQSLLLHTLSLGRTAGKCFSECKILSWLEKEIFWLVSTHVLLVRQSASFEMIKDTDLQLINN